MDLADVHLETTRVIPNENLLISQSQGGDTQAFCLLAQRYERRIYSLALHYCRNSHDAEDLSQEVWLKAFQALKTFRGESTFYTWLRRITINCFLNHRRARFFRRDLKSGSSQLAPDDSAISEYTGEDNLETTVANKIMVDRVLKALSAVSPNQRLIFLLKHHEGMTCDEIGRELGCSTGSVKKSLFRTVSKLRAQLETNEPPDYVPCAAGQY
jgi:RNA polymerase sigma-70 factor (ECF subfamily)